MKGKKYLKGSLCLILAFSMLVSSTYAKTEYNEITLLEEVENEYTGTPMAAPRLETIAFSDVPNGHWAKESIARAGALELIKGWDDHYYPSKNVSRAEMLGICVRLMGRNMEAENSTNATLANWDKNVSTKYLWAIGHMKICQQLGFILDTDYNDAVYPDQTALSEDKGNFLADNGALRAEVAKWICQTLEIIAPDVVNQNTYDFHYSNIYKYNDWNSIPMEYRVYVDMLNKLDVMIGSDGCFYPNKRITRAEVAKLLENLDNNYYNFAGLTKKMGYVADILYDVEQQNDEDFRHIYTYFRSYDGRVDRMHTTQSRNNIGQITKNETVVYKGGAVGAAARLVKGDIVNYLINSDGEVVYVEVEDENLVKVNAKLYDTRFIEDGQITILLNDGRYVTCVLKYELYDKTNKTLLIDDTKYKMDSLPFTTFYTFTMKGNVVTQIDYKGEEEVYKEERGVVQKVDTTNNTIYYYNDKGKVVSKKWASDLEVEKQDYYETSDDIGYIDEVFKEYLFDKMDSSPESIEAGDTIFIQSYSNGEIKSLGVGTNYGVKYGKIKAIEYRGVEGSSIIISYDDETSETMDVEPEVIVKKSGRKTTLSTLQVGDYVRVLYNRGIISPNNVYETIKQINISSVEKEVTDILKGELISFDNYQGEMIFADVEKLESLGWTNFTNIKTIDVDKNCLYYVDDKRVSLDYIKEFMERNGTAYMAIGKSLGKDVIIKLSFRTSRESILGEDNVSYAKGNGEFKLTSDSKSYVADEGTIVVRYGRLVDKEGIMSPDLAKVVLNGDRSAAIVDINEEITNNELGIYRAKIKSLVERKSFEVYSFSKLLDMEWSYMPLERNFEIDAHTDIYSGGAKIMYYDFIDYTDASQIDNIYTIFAMGDEAILLNDIPYVDRGITGQVYKIEGSTFKLKDVVSWNKEKKTWEEISYNDRTLDVEPGDPVVYIKNNEIVDADEIEVGDKLRVMGLDDGLTTKQGSGAYTGYIIYIER